MLHWDPSKVFRPELGEHELALFHEVVVALVSTTVSRLASPSFDDSQKTSCPDPFLPGSIHAGAVMWVGSSIVHNDRQGRNAE